MASKFIEKRNENHNQLSIISLSTFWIQFEYTRNLRKHSTIYTFQIFRMKVFTKLYFQHESFKYFDISHIFWFSWKGNITSLWLLLQAHILHHSSCLMILFNVLCLLTELIRMTWKSALKTTMTFELFNLIQ